MFSGSSCVTRSQDLLVLFILGRRCRRRGNGSFRRSSRHSRRCRSSSGSGSSSRCALVDIAHLVVKVVYLLDVLIIIAVISQPGEHVQARLAADGGGDIPYGPVDLVPGLLAAGDLGGGPLALLDLDGRSVDDVLGALEAPLVAPPGLCAQDRLAAALGLLGDAGALVDAEDRGPVVDGLGRWLDVLEGLVCVDAW